VSQLNEVEKHWFYDLQSCILVWDSKLVLFNFHFVLLLQVESVSNLHFTCLLSSSLFMTFVVTSVEYQESLLNIRDLVYFSSFCYLIKVWTVWLWVFFRQERSRCIVNVLTCGHLLIRTRFLDVAAFYCYIIMILFLSKILFPFVWKHLVS